MVNQKAVDAFQPCNASDSLLREYLDSIELIKFYSEQHWLSELQQKLEKEQVEKVSDVGKHRDDLRISRDGFGRGADTDRAGDAGR